MPLTGLAKVRKRITEVLLGITNSARIYRTSPFSVAKRVFILYQRRQFSFAEIFGQALVDPALNEDDLATYVAKERVWPFFEKMNAHHEQKMIDDKFEFQKSCEAGHIPVPELLDVYTPCPLTNDKRGRNNEDNDFWRAQFLQNFPDRFIAKPSFGLKGYGVMIINRNDKRLCLHDGQVMETETLLDLFDEADQIPTIHSYYSGTDHKILFQRAVPPHPELEMLCGKPAVQCVRACTVLDPSDRPHLLFTFLKVVVGDNFLDNFDRGERGNLLAFIDEKSGKITRVIGRDPSSIVATTFDHHPDTKVPFIGYQIPYWPEVRELAFEAARHFRPVGAVGWDIAITPTGPVLIEGNSAWDPVAPFSIGIDELMRWTAERAEMSHPQTIDNRLETAPAA